MASMTDSLVEKLETELKSGFFGSDGRLPSLRTLALRYSCSLGTIKRTVDMLADQRILHSIHGKGVFYAGANFQPLRKANRVLGAIVLKDECGDALLEMRRAYLDKGWLMAVYNASEDFQDPVKELEFLNLAERERFAGIMLVPTPIEPVNGKAYRRLRDAGMKIALIGSYAVDMPDDTYFLVDRKAAGSLMMSQAAMRGYRHAVYCDTVQDAPYKRALKAGGAECAAALSIELLPPVECPVWRNADVESQRECFSKVEGQLAALPPNTAVLCLMPSLSRLSIRSLRANGRDVPGDIGVASLVGCGEEDGFSHIGFDAKALVNSALEHLTDGEAGSFKSVQRLFPPRFEDRGTLRKAFTSMKNEETSHAF